MAAVVELEVPEDEFPGDDYGSLVFGGDNVDLDVTDNDFSGGNAHILCAGLTSPDHFTLTDDELVRTSGVNFGDDETYKWLFFAKVTDDDASLYAKLIDGAGSEGFDATESSLGDELLAVTLGGTDYDIYKNGVGDDGGYYLITYWDDTDDDDTDKLVCIYLFVDEDYVTEGMSIDLNLVVGTDDEEDATALGVNTKNELGIVEGALIDTGDDAEDYLDFYSNVVVEEFGMDYFKIGNYLRDSFIEDLVSSDTLVATVDIEPWTAYVTVPDNIVLDPPKTVDAASIMGFVMVALSGAGVVALRKRG